MGQKWYGIFKCEWSRLGWRGWDGEGWEVQPPDGKSVPRKGIVTAGSSKGREKVKSRSKRLVILLTVKCKQQLPQDSR